MSQYAKVATDAVKKIASHPTVANALNTTQRHVEAVTDATGTVFTETVHKNLKELSSSKYIVSDTKQKQELYKHAFYTSVSEVPLIWRKSRQELGEWMGAVKEFGKAPTQAQTSHVFMATVFAVEVCAWWKVGEFFGRGRTLFGYWP